MVAAEQNGAQQCLVIAAEPRGACFRMPEDRVITYPADATQRLADRLQDDNWDLDGESATEIARDIVIEVTEAVDRLREQESASHRDVIERAAARLAAVYSEDGPTGTPDQVDEAIGGALLILGEMTSA